MAKLWYSHFDSAEGDKRLLLAEDWARYIRGFVTDGIRNGGDCLQVRADGTLNLKILSGTDKNGAPADGVANIQGYIFNLRPDNDGDSWPVAVPASHPAGARIDRLVLRLDRTIPNRNITPYVLQGDAGSNPVPPALTRNDNIWEISLARWRMNSGAAGLTQNDITDERFDDSLCGLMHSVLGLDSSAWQRQFDELMAAVTARDDVFLAAQLTKFNSQLSAQQSEFAGLTDAYAAWWSTVKGNLALYAAFDPDNPLAYPGTKTEISGLDTDVVTETKTNSANGKTVMTRTTDFAQAGYICVETLKVWDTGTNALVIHRQMKTADDGKYTESVADLL